MPPDSKLPEMAAKTREILGRVQRMVPPMLEHFHKGEAMMAVRLCSTTRLKLTMPE